MITKTAEEHSQRIFWVVQTIFGYVIGRSFHTFANVLIPPFESDILTVSIAFAAVYTVIIWSWIDFSYTLIVNPYQFRNNALEKFRFLSDLFIVTIYTYLLVYLDFIDKNPSGKITEFFIANAFVFVGYLISGLLRRKQYNKRASRIDLIVVALILFSSISLLYLAVFQEGDYAVLINRGFILSMILFTVLYRWRRSVITKRKYRIAVDVDGVLANQISGILPIVKKEYNVDIKYEDVKSWNLQIADTGIDKIIVSQQSKRAYVVGMPPHPDAMNVMDGLITKYYISIATARPPASDFWTKKWLSENKIPYDNYNNLKEGEKHNSEEEFDILIDDYLGNITKFLENSDGIAILFTQPWNQNRNELQGYISEKRLFIVSAWKEIPLTIEQAIKSKESKKKKG